MAIIVEHRDNGRRFLLLAAGLRGGPVLGQEGPSALVACCDEEGTIGWIEYGRLTVVEVDGRPPAAHLGARRPYR